MKSARNLSKKSLPLDRCDAQTLRQHGNASSNISLNSRSRFSKNSVASQYWCKTQKVLPCSSNYCFSSGKDRKIATSHFNEELSISDDSVIESVVCSADRYARQSKKLKSQIGGNVVFNKEQYMLANHQFIVSCNVPLNTVCNNPDANVDWDNIEAVIVKYGLEEGNSIDDVISCPICLCVPQPAKIAKCGHQYCWPCAVRYIRYVDDLSQPFDPSTGTAMMRMKRDCGSSGLMTRDERISKKCAICCEHIYLSQLKTAVNVPQRMLSQGDVIRMRLMRRFKDSIVVHPAAIEQGDADDGARGMLKFRHPDRDELLFLYRTELEQLAMTLGDHDDETVRYFVDRLGLDVCADGIDNITSDTADVFTFGDCVKELDTCSFDDKRESSYLSENLVDFSASSQSDIVESVPMEHASTLDPSSFYFYQEESGQCIYLDSLNWQCLSAEFGEDISQFPSIIEGIVLEMRDEHMNQYIRKRFRYLAHLPLTCQFQLVELNLEHLLSAYTKEKFSEQLRRRCMERKRKARKEKMLQDQERMRLELEQKELYDKFQRNIYASSGSVQFTSKSSGPNFNDNDFVPLGSPALMNKEALRESPSVTASTSNMHRLSYCKMAQLSNAVGPDSLNNSPVSWATRVNSLAKDVEVNEGVDDFYNPPECPLFTLRVKEKKGKTKK